MRARYNPSTGGIDLVSDTGTGSASAAGSDTQIQYNSSGSFAGSADLTWNDTTKELGVGGDINLDNGGTFTGSALKLTGSWYVGANPVPQALIQPAGTANSTAWSTSGTGLGINAASGFAGNLLDLQVNGTSRTVVTGSGDVGIGIIAPAALLHTSKSSSLDTNVIFQNPSTSDTATSTIYLSSGTVPTTRGAYIRNGIQTLGSSNRYLAFAVNNTGQTLAEGMRLTSAGLGIGTVSPTEKLEVVGTIKATDINFTGLATYANNAAALTGGLVAGDVYKTATGELRITV